MAGNLWGKTTYPSEVEAEVQPIAIAAIACGLVMVAGVSATLVRTRHDASERRRTGVNRWQFNGSVPLAGAGIALGVISRDGGQTAVTHDVLFAVTSLLLLGAVLCALAGAIAATRGRSDGTRA